MLRANHYLTTLRLARDLCWAEWHAPDRQMFERNQAQLGYKMLQHAITVGINKAVKELKKGNHK